MVSRLRPRDGVSRVASALVVYVPSPLPRWSCWVLIAPFPSSGSFPCEVVRSASTLLFSRPAQRLLTLQPAHSPNRLTILSIEGFRRLVALPSAPIATGWSDPCREGFAPSQELCLSTAHDFITTMVAFWVFGTHKPKRDCRRDEHIHRSDAISVIAEECPPALGRRVSPPDHVLGHAGLSDIDAKLEQLSMDPRRSP